MKQKPSSADRAQEEQGVPGSELPMTAARRDSYRGWRAPDSLRAEAVRRFSAKPASASRRIGWGAAVAAGLTLTVVLLMPGEPGGDVPAGADEPGMSTLALNDVHIPPKPDFPSMASVSMPARTLTIPRLNQISLSFVTQEETL